MSGEWEYDLFSGFLVVKIIDMRGIFVYIILYVNDVEVKTC